MAHRPWPIVYGGRKRVLSTGMAHFWAITKTSDDYVKFYGNFSDGFCRFHNVICLSFGQVKSRLNQTLSKKLKIDTTTILNVLTS